MFDIVLCIFLSSDALVLVAYPSVDFNCVFCKIKFHLCTDGFSKDETTQ